MKKFWYLPVAVVAGTASLTVWAQGSAGPPPAVSPGVVVADVQSGGTATPGEQPALLATPTPTPSITAIPGHTAPETQRIQVELQTYPPLQPTHSPTHGVGDDKGGLRDDSESDDGPGDDKGGDR